MDRKNLKKLQQISHRLHSDQTDVANEFISGLQKHLAARGYRADLAIATDARNTEGRFTANVKFDTGLGYPAEGDLMTIVGQSYPNHQIDWDLVQVDSDDGVVVLCLEPAMEVVPIKDINSIPPEFKPIGTALYKRAVDATGQVNEIWTLKRDDDGLALYRSHDDLEVLADDDEDGFKANDVVNTPHGPGKIVRFDELGNAFVQIGNKTRLVAAIDTQKYDIDKERKQLEELYTQIYGDREFAKDLVKEYGKYEPLY